MGDDMLRTSKRRWRANRDRALSLYFLFLFSFCLQKRGLDTGKDKIIND